MLREALHMRGNACTPKFCFGQDDTPSEKIRHTAEVMECYSVFKGWDFARKNRAKSKSNLCVGAQGRSAPNAQYQLLIVSHFPRMSHCFP
jgi:hypothetical protein